MMLEGGPTSKHNHAECLDCSLEWDGDTALIDGAFHQQVSDHDVICRATVKCHDGCCP